jgi:SAM-dependent methyltransferase
VISAPDVPCPCGVNSYAKVSEAVYRRGFPTSYGLYRCVSCGLVRTSPTPDPSIYAGLDFAEDEPKDRAWLTSLDNDFRQLATRVDDLPLLDLGCNTGELVATFAAAGVRSVGCDIDSRAVEVGRRSGLDLLVSNVEEEPPPGRYGVVVCVHTLEHTLRPERIVRNVAMAMPPGATLYIRVPNFGGLLPRVMRNDWGFLVPYQHTWQFTHRTLVDLVTREGLFEVERVSSRVHLEYDTPGAKGLLKRGLKLLAATANASDEIRATFRRSTGTPALD